MNSFRAVEAGAGVRSSPASSERVLSRTEKKRLGDPGAQAETRGWNRQAAVRPSPNAAKRKRATTATSPTPISCRSPSLGSSCRIDSLRTLRVPRRPSQRDFRNRSAWVSTMPMSSIECGREKRSPTTSNVACERLRRRQTGGQLGHARCSARTE